MEHSTSLSSSNVLHHLPPSPLPNIIATDLAPTELFLSRLPPLRHAISLSASQKKVSPPPSLLNPRLPIPTRKRYHFLFPSSHRSIPGNGRFATYTPTLSHYRITSLCRIETAVAALYIGTEDRAQGRLAGFRSASDGEDRPFSGPVQAALTRAGKIADVADSAIISSHHVLLAVLELDPQQQKNIKDHLNVALECEAWEFLQSLGVLDVNVTATDFGTALLDNVHGDGPELATGFASSSNSPTLDTVGTDSTQQAIQEPIHMFQVVTRHCRLGSWSQTVVQLSPPQDTIYGNNADNFIT